MTDTHFTLFKPVTLPSPSVRTCFKPQPLKISTPSSWALAISSADAGMSSRCSRQTSFTFWAPRHTAVSATSIATFPPPQTRTSLPICLLINCFTSTRKFSPNCVRFSPSKPRIGCFHAPVSKNTVSLASFTSSSDRPFPISVLVLNKIPIPARALTRSRT